MPNYDILGRELKEGDIVVVKGNGGYGTPQKAMEVGIMQKNSVRTITGVRNPKDKFLVVNPSEKELEIKEAILMALELKEKAKKKQSKIDSTKVGMIYKINASHNNCCNYCIYLGYGEVTYTSDKKLKTKSGHFYLMYTNHNEKTGYLTSLNEIFEKACNKYYFDFENMVLKNPKSVIAEVGMIYNSKGVFDNEIEYSWEKPRSIRVWNNTTSSWELEEDISKYHFVFKREII